MALTTFAQIRDAQVTAIRAITPTQHPTLKFALARGEKPLREWAKANPQAAFRQFTISNGFSYTGPEISNCDVIWQRMTEIVEVAYPRQMGRYGSDNERDMHDLIDADWRKIDGAIGHVGYASFVAGQNFCSLLEGQPSIEQDGDLVFLTMQYEVGFSRAI